MTAAPQANTRAPLIYIVDDEPLLLDLAEVALMGKGYCVKRFNDPSEVLAALAKESQMPSLLLTDYAMGSMNGLELTERCRELFPGIKVLLVSGTVTQEIVGVSRVPLDGFIAKPYQPSTLADTVRALVADV
jgi:two-component system, cell cycle sensor histidine kinase and response regulator CckA